MNHISSLIYGFSAIAAVSYFGISGSLLEPVVIFSAYIPFILLSFVFGYKYGEWYKKEDNGHLLLEIISVPIIVVLLSAIISGLIFGTSALINKYYISENIFNLEPTIGNSFKTVAFGVFAGALFLYKTIFFHLVAGIIASYLALTSKGASNAL